MIDVTEESIESILHSTASIADHFAGTLFCGKLAIETKVVTPDPDVTLFALVLQTLLERYVPGQDFVPTRVHQIENNLVFVFEGDFLCIALEIPSKNTP
jgi:hypothetical protein